MTDQDNVLELINAEIDGELTGQQRAELNRLLLADPAVRALRDDLVRTCRALDTLPREEIPADLHAAIVAGIPLARPKGCTSRWSSLLHGPTLRFAAAFGGGLLVSALAFQLGSLDPSQVGAGQLAGTIAASGTAEARMIVDLPQAQGSITLSGSAQAPRLVTSLEARQPVSIVTRLHESGEVEVEVVDDATAVVLQRGKLRVGSQP